MSEASSSSQTSDYHIDCIDVGHGSAIVVAQGAKATMIDTGPGGPILEYLMRAGIKEVDTVVLSHADQDHIAGLVAMLDAGFVVHNIVCNSDAAKKSKLWLSLVYSMDDMLRRGVTVSITDAVEGATLQTVVPEISLDLLAPRIRISKLGPGANDAEGLKLTTNTLSVVVMIKSGDDPLLLFTGDIDAVGCLHLLDSKVSLKADYLVLPHHGGLMGSSTATRDSIKSLCEVVQPKQVFVSNGRTKYDNPQPIVVEAVREALPNIPIACAQLSPRCSVAGGPREASESDLYSHGRPLGYSCAGSIRLTLSDGIETLRNTDSHAAFVDEFAPTALCRAGVHVNPFSGDHGAVPAAD